MKTGNVPKRAPSRYETEYRAAVRKIVLGLATGQTQLEIAAKLGCTTHTLYNAQEQHSSLSGEYLFGIMMEYGGEAIRPLLEAAGCRPVPITASCDTDALPTTSAAVHKLAIAQSPNSPGGIKLHRSELLAMEHEVRAAQESLAAIECLIKQAKGEAA